MAILDTDATSVSDIRHTAEQYDIELIIPALNEEQRLAPTIGALRDEMLHLGRRGRFLVVDNGCADATAEIADRLSGPVPVEVVGCHRRGKGAAVRAGILRTTASIVGYCDADLSTPPDSLRAGLNLLAAGADVVAGSRRCSGGEYVVPQPVHRRVGGAAFRLLSRRMTGPLSDTQCGFKLFRGAVGRSLFAATDASGFAFDVEVLALALQRQARVVELPIAWQDSPGSTFRPLVDGIAAVSELRALARAQRACG